MADWTKLWDCYRVMATVVWAMIVLCIVFFSFLTVLKHALFTREKVIYLCDLLTPFGFVSCFGLRALLLSPASLAPILLSGEPQAYRVEEFHYAVLLVTNPMDLESP